MYCLESEVTKKLRYLRSQYGDELKKTQESRSGMATEEVYVPKWKFFYALSFLKPYVILRRSSTLSNLEVSVQCSIIYHGFTHKSCMQMSH